MFQRYPELVGLNEGESGKWKIESINLIEGVFLKSKQYSLKYFQDELQFDELKCKGIPARSLRNTTHEDYKAVLLEQKVVHIPIKLIRSINHRLYNLTVDKVAFHYLDIMRVYPDPDNPNISLQFSHQLLNDCECMKT